MSAPAWQAAERAAQELGLIQTGHSVTPDTGAPWPLRLMMALGGWLVALPMLALLALLVVDSFKHFGGLVWGCVGMGIALAVLRARPGLFAEQLLVAVLVASLLLSGASVGDEVHWTAGLWTVGVLCALLPWWLPQGWLRAALGAGAASALGWAVADQGDWELFDRSDTVVPWLVLHAWVLLAGAALAMADGWRTGAWKAVWLQRLNDLAQGWMAVTLVGLAVLSGMAFLVGGVVDAGAVWDLVPNRLPLWTRVASAALALLAAGVLARRWAALRQAWLAGVALVLAALAWTMPTLGGVWLALALLVLGQRMVLAGAAAVAAAWVISAFYYSLSMPLTDKALLLLVLSVGLTGLAWWGGARRRGAGADQGSAAGPSVAAPQQPQASGRWAWGAALSAALVLLVANVGIWQKEQLIRHGQAVFVPLAPADPRSLMQGDFMRLEFVGWQDRWAINEQAAEGQPHVVLRLDDQRIAQVLRFEHGTQAPLAEGELRLPLTHKAGNWVLVTDAFYFKEGEAERWEAARFGEFRIDPSGRALLVGLRGEALAPL